MLSSVHHKEPLHKISAEETMIGNPCVFSPGPVKMMFQFCHEFGFHLYDPIKGISGLFGSDLSRTQNPAK